MGFVVRAEVARGWTQFRRVRIALVRSYKTGNISEYFSVRTDICVGEEHISADASVCRAGWELTGEREEEEKNV